MVQYSPVWIFTFDIGQAQIFSAPAHWTFILSIISDENLQNPVRVHHLAFFLLCGLKPNP